MQPAAVDLQGVSGRWCWPTSAISEHGQIHVSWLGFGLGVSSMPASMSPARAEMIALGEVNPSAAATDALLRYTMAIRHPSRRFRLARPAADVAGLIRRDGSMFDGAHRRRRCARGRAASNAADMD